MEEIKWTNTGADPIDGSDPVSVNAKAQTQIEETKRSPETAQSENPEPPVKEKTPAKKKAPVKELSVASFVMKKRDEAPEDEPEKAPQRKKKKRPANGTSGDESKENAGPSVLKREKRRPEEAGEPRRKKRKRPPQQAMQVQEERDEEEQTNNRNGLAKFITRLIVFLILAAVISGIIVMNLFRLKEIRVSGNKNYSREQIIEMVGIPQDAGNTLLTYMKFKNEKANDKPLIKYLRVYMADRNTLGIDVAETAIVGEIKYIGNHYCFDDGGYVQEITTERKKGVPKVTGINIHEPQVGEQIQTDDDGFFANITELCQMLTERKIDVDEIEIAGDNSITIYVDDNIRIAFGSALLMEAKVSEIVNILPELIRMEESEGLSGTLHLENYSTFQKSIVFTPEELPERDSDGEESGKKKKSRKKDDGEDDEDEDDEDEDADDDDSDSDWNDDEDSYDEVDEDAYSDWADE